MFGRQAITARSHHGFTLMELTVVLGVIVTLALVLMPSIGNFINDSRSARARRDCQTIASAIVQFYRDNGFFPSWKLAQKGDPGLPQNRVQLLVSPGNVALEDQPSLWTTGVVGLLSEQLMTDVPGYSRRAPTSQFGWNGPYLSSGISADPWGNRYIVNIDLINASATGNGGGVKAAVWVLSAGHNGIIETPFGQSILSAALVNDDIGVRLQ
jgi:prepilin-type N-terminal cleavage/methylation domain-containing protein